MDKGTALSYKKKTCYDSIYITGMSFRFSNPGGQEVVRWAQSASPHPFRLEQGFPKFRLGLSPPSPPANDITYLYCKIMPS